MVFIFFLEFFKHAFYFSEGVDQIGTLQDNLFSERLLNGKEHQNFSQNGFLYDNQDLGQRLKNGN